MEEGFASARGARGGTAPIASSTSPSWHASKPSSSARRAALSACDIACSLCLFVCEPRDLKIYLRTIAWHSLPRSATKGSSPLDVHAPQAGSTPHHPRRSHPTLRGVLESSDEVDASQAPADREGKEKHKRRRRCWAPGSRRSRLASHAPAASRCTSSRRRSGAATRSSPTRCDLEPGPSSK